MLHQFVAQGVAELSQLEDNVRADDLAAAATLICRAARVHVLAQRRAFPVAAYLSYALGQLDIKAQLLDGAIKEEAAAVLAAMGLTVSDAVRLLLTKVAQDKALPFEPLIPNATTIEAMKEARKGKLPRFATVNDLMADLHAAD